MKRSKVASFSLPAEVVRYTDEIAKAENKSRSKVVREALESHRVSKEWAELQVYGDQQARRLGIKDEKDVERLVHEYRRKRG